MQLEFPTPEAKIFHRTALTICWCLLLNVSIVAVMYRNHKYALLVHQVLSILIMIFTSAACIQFLIPDGLDIIYQGKDFIQWIHDVLGAVFVAILFAQFFSGMISKRLQVSHSSNPTNLIRSKKFHYCLGYILVIFAKFNILNGWFQAKDNQMVFYCLLAYELISLLIFICLKTAFLSNYFKLQGRILDPQLKSIGQIPEIKNTDQLESFIVFCNYIYDLALLLNSHPGGIAIIQAAKNREVDRFLYGLYSPELFPQIPALSHSSNSLRLIGLPIGYLKIRSAMKGFIQLNNCKISKREKYGNQGKNFMIVYLKLQEAQNKLKYQGYTQLSQFAQFFSLTIDRVTRLYTCVYCLRKKNIKNMEKIFKNLFDGIKFTSQILSPQQNSVDDNIPMPLQQITLMMKIYIKGKLTPVIAKNQLKQTCLQLSSPRGQGMRLEKFTKGRIVIVAGGTGICPFMDLIDIIFKIYFINDEKKQSSQEKAMKMNLIKQDPILQKKEFFENIKFHFILAVRSTRDIHPLTLKQLDQLSRNQIISCMIKVSQQTPSELLKYHFEIFKPKSDITKYQDFQQQISRQIDKLKNKEQSNNINREQPQMRENNRHQLPPLRNNRQPPAESSTIEIKVSSKNQQQQSTNLQIKAEIQVRQVVKKVIQKEQQTVKMYICGPPQMNTVIIKQLKQKNISKKKYMIV